jgi:hypothetical protein
LSVFQVRDRVVCCQKQDTSNAGGEGNKRNAPPQHRDFIFIVYKYFQDCLAEIQGGKAGRLQSAAFQGEFLLKCEKGAKCRVMLSIESNSFFNIFRIVIVVFFY